MGNLKWLLTQKKRKFLVITNKEIILLLSMSDIQKQAFSSPRKSEVAWFKQYLVFLIECNLHEWIKKLWFYAYRPFLWLSMLSAISNCT